MTLSQRIIWAKIEKAEQEQSAGYCPVCLESGHAAGACLLQQR